MSREVTASVGVVAVVDVAVVDVVGNDVVDLRDADASPEGRHPRFDAKAFTAAERSFIGSGSGAERRRWSLWAAKEAAHKALRQEDPALGFAPRRYAVTLDAAGEGSVRRGAREVRVRVRAGADRIHAVAFRGDPARVLSGIATLSQLGEREPRGAARRLLLGSFPGAEDVRLERVERVPRVRLGGRTLPVSLSHHGRLVAYARLAEGA